MATGSADVLPEERELSEKQTHLATLEERLAQAELEVTTLQAELHSLEREYFRTVVVRLVTLDEIEARIAEAIVRQRPQNDKVLRDAKRARTQANDTSAAFESIFIDKAKQTTFQPSEDLRAVYLKVAKAVHPDMTTDENDRSRRHKYMAAANEAYEEGDIERLKNILQEWRSNPEAITGDGTGAELIRTIRKIAQVNLRLSAIQSEIELLRQSELFRMWEKVQKFRESGRELLTVMAEELDDQIRAANKRLEEVLAKGKRNG